jgi:DNA-binding CsgD family transcriptional regulator
LHISGEALDSSLFALIRFYDDDVDMIVPERGEGLLDRYKLGEWPERDPRGRRGLALPEMAITRDDDILAPGERATSDFYRDFTTNEDVPYCAFWRFSDGERHFVFTSMRSGESGPAGDADIAAIRALQDSATAAALLSSHMHHAHERGLVEGLSAAGAAAIILGDGGKVIAATPQAEAALERDFAVQEGRLDCGDPAASAALRRLNARLGARRADVAAPAFHIPRETGRGLACYPVANTSSEGLDIFTDVRAVLLLRDADASPRPDANLLSLRFGLTPAEIDIASQLACGSSLESISAARGVTIATTRTILRSIFRKTGVRRQSELVALLAKL